MRKRKTVSLKHLYYRLFAIVVAVFLCLLLIIYHVSMVTFFNQQSEQLQAHISESIDHMSESLENSLYQFSSFTYTESVISFVSSSPYIKYRLANSINSTLDTLLDANPYVLDVGILTRDGQCIYSNRSSNEVALLRSFIYSIRDKRFQDIQPNRFFKAGNLPFYAAMIPFFGITGSSAEAQYCGSCIVVIDPLVFLTHFLDTESYPCALRVNSDIISTANFPVEDAALMESAFTGDLNGTRLSSSVPEVHFVSDRVASVDWDILCAYKDPLVDSHLLSLLFCCAGIFLILVMLFISVFLYRKTAYPILDLERQIECIGARERKETTALGNIAEIFSLSGHTNAMIRNLEIASAQKIRIQEQLHKARANELQAQVLFLQSQINPHFLYNTLECICGLLSRNEIWTARKTIVSLSKIYRYCTEGTVYSTVHEELEMVEDYLRIINTVMMDVHLSVFVDSAIANAPIPKMTLQPLVENAVQHGFLHAEQKEKRISIRFSADSNEVPFFEISDNGVGMDPRQIENVRSDLKSRMEIDGAAFGKEHSVGLRNVLLRLHLLGSGNDFFEIRNLPEGGLFIHCSFPVLLPPEEDENLQ